MLWSKKDAARWPIETKILVDMALDAGREVKVVEGLQVWCSLSMACSVITRLSNPAMARMGGAVSSELGPTRYYGPGHHWPSDSVGVESMPETTTLGVLNRAFKKFYSLESDLEPESANIRRRR